MSAFLRSLPSPRLAALVRATAEYAPGRVPEVVAEAARRCPPTPRTLVIEFSGPAWREAAGLLPYDDAPRLMPVEDQGGVAGADEWCRPRHIPREFMRVVRSQWRTVVAYAAPIAAVLYLVFFR